MSTSRGRRNLRVFVDDVKEVREAIAHSSARPSAHELIEGTINREATRELRMKAWRQRLKRAAGLAAKAKSAMTDWAVGTQDVSATHYDGRVRENAAELGD